jgi:hypothetical protein
VHRSSALAGCRAGADAYGIDQLHTQTRSGWLKAAVRESHGQKSGSREANENRARVPSSGEGTGELTDCSRSRQAMRVEAHCFRSVTTVIRLPEEFDACEGVF